MATINDDVDKILIRCGFNSSSNREDIAEYGFESLKNIMSLTMKDIVNL